MDSRNYGFSFLIGVAPILRRRPAEGKPIMKELKERSRPIFRRGLSSSRLKSLPHRLTDGALIAL